MFLFSVVGSGKWRLSNWSGGCWALLGFFFCCVFCCLAQCPGKNDFWVGEIIFNSWRVAAAGICWDWQTAWKKVIFGLGKSFCEIGEWRLLGFAGISSFTVSTAVWQSAGEKNDFCVGKMIFLKLETSDCWDLLGFLLLRCRLLFGRVQGKKMIFGWGKWFFWTWRLAIAGVCWDFSFFALSTATSTWQTARKKMIFGSGKSFFWNWRVAIAGICWDFFFYGVDCCLAGCPEKKWFLGRENHFSEVGD